MSSTSKDISLDLREPGFTLREFWDWFMVPFMLWFILVIKLLNELFQFCIYRSMIYLFDWLADSISVIISRWLERLFSSLTRVYFFGLNSLSSYGIDWISLNWVFNSGCFFRCISKAENGDFLVSEFGIWSFCVLDCFRDEMNSVVEFERESEE